MAQHRLPFLRLLVLWLPAVISHGVGLFYGSTLRAIASRGGGSAASSKNKSCTENDTGTVRLLTRSYYDDDFISDSDDGDVYGEADECSDSDGHSRDELSINLDASSQEVWSSDASNSKPASEEDSTTVMRRTAIVVHGCHLAADRWEQLVWGDPAQQLVGRLAHAAILTANDPTVSLVVCGTGGSSRGGIPEGAYTKQYLFRNLPRLRSFTAADGINVESLSKRLEQITVAECESQNTVKELAAAFDLAQRAGCTRVVLVSSPTHLPRCLRDACAFIHQRRCSHAGRKNSGLVAAPGASSGELEALRTTRAAQEAKTGKTEKEDDNNEAYEDQENNWVPLELLASPSETCYDGSVPSDVVQVVLEPAHRGDRDTRLDGPLSLARLVQRSLKLNSPPSLRKPPLPLLPSEPARSSSTPLAETSSMPDAAAGKSAPGIADFKLAFAHDLNTLLSWYESGGIRLDESTQISEVAADTSADAAEKRPVAPDVQETTPSTMPTPLPPPPSQSPLPSVLPSSPLLSQPPLGPGQYQLRGPGDALALALHRALLRRSRDHYQHHQNHLQLHSNLGNSPSCSSANNDDKPMNTSLAQKWRNIVLMGLTTPPQGFVPLPGFAPPLTTVDITETSAPFGDQWQRADLSPHNISDNINDGCCRFTYHSAGLRDSLDASLLRLDTRLKKCSESCSASTCTTFEVSALTGAVVSTNLNTTQFHDDQATVSNATATRDSRRIWMVAMLGSDVKLKLDVESFVSLNEEDPLVQDSSSDNSSIIGANEVMWRVNTEALYEALRDALGDDIDDASNDDNGIIATHTSNDNITDEDGAPIDDHVDPDEKINVHVVDESNGEVDYISKVAFTAIDNTRINLVVEDNSTKVSKLDEDELFSHMVHSGKLDDVLATRPDFENISNLDEVQEWSKGGVETDSIPVVTTVTTKKASESAASIATTAATEMAKPSVDYGAVGSKVETKEAKTLKKIATASKPPHAADVPGAAFGTSMATQDSPKPSAMQTEVTEALGEPPLLSKSLADDNGINSISKGSQMNRDSKQHHCRRRRWWRLWLF